ncbi:BPSS1780 family membrane protein [Pseudoduganella sp. LjRoot289]|uniref:BPSS1780 family membrane protein n=1 Tax=Pseudoduganella sp. LjRoot289 TaxID=3342314 RepID=UPI003ECF6286
MGKFPASTGWLWIKQGFQLFLRQPGGLTSLAMLYAMLNLVMNLVPVVGQLASIVLIPAFSVAFMQACLDIEQGKRVLPALLLTGFRKPAFLKLLAVGLLYVSAAALAIGLSSLADDGMLLKLLTGKVDPNSKEAREASLGSAFVMIMLVGLPAAMAFCFSAPLIYFQNMGVGKAMFFSFFAVWRALKTFIVFAFSQFGLMLVLTQIIGMLFGGSPKVLVMVMQIVLLLFSVLIHCSFYSSYRQIFGIPDQK